MKYFYKMRGWLLIRPIRWFFGNMGCACYLRVLPERCEWSNEWRMSNLHWWLLYKTVFKLFKWVNYEGWRFFCVWGKNWRQTYPLIARVIHKIGQTTAGYAISGGECFHCAAECGCPVTLSEDETGKYFVCEKAWTEGTQDGTDHRFRGTTTCPRCGYQQTYEDGSL